MGERIIEAEKEEEGMEQRVKLGGDEVFNCNYFQLRSDFYF
jgi:hypothetical protein